MPKRPMTKRSGLLFAALLLASIGALAGAMEDAEAAYGREDYAGALKILRVLAAGGDATARYVIGSMYGDGRGVAQDHAEAVVWYRQAAERGHAGAQARLGALYFQGHGLRKDDVRAHMWFNLGAAAGNAEALRGRDLVASRMKPQQITRAQNLARECQESKFRDCD